MTTMWSGQTVPSWRRRRAGTNRSAIFSDDYKCYALREKVRGRPNYLLAHRHAETKLVVLVDVVHPSERMRFKPALRRSSRESGDDAVVIDATANSALSQDVVVSNAGRGAALIQFHKKSVANIAFSLTFKQYVRDNRPAVRHLPCRDSLIIRVPRGESDARLTLTTQVEPLTTQSERRRDALQVVDPVELPACTYSALGSPNP